MDSNQINRRGFIKTGAASLSGAAAVSLSAKDSDVAATARKNAGQMANSKIYGLRYRQVHLDFHTSEDIEGIGDAFDAEEFASTLERARVNSVTCFGRCHHGWIYHRTGKFPERRHPHHKRNILEEQIEACHKKDIRVPVYVTVQWDHYTARNNPEWLQISEQGSWNGTPPYEAGFYRRLCMNSPYREFLKAYLAELFETVPIDGLFLDIVHPQDCSCTFCMRDMLAAGIEASLPAARLQFGYDVFMDFIFSMTEFIRGLDRNCSIFYNSGHIGPRHRGVVGGYSHLELESLPSGGWGYLHFPLTMRYARNLGIDCMGMTGKFHTSWGDFHSFKNKPALEFECFNMLALNGKCSVGDQLHPNGKIDAATYELIGSVYQEVEKKEPWCRGAKAVTEIGVLSPEEFLEYGQTSRTPPAALGAVRMLQEGAHQFEILDSMSDFSPYKVLILPDQIPVSNSLAAKLSGYLAGGGSILASFESGLHENEKEFALPSLGIRKSGDGPVDTKGIPVRGKPAVGNAFAEYIIPRGALGKGLPETEHVMYMNGLPVEALPGTEVMAQNVTSYFDRTYRHFCSHRQTPSSGKTGTPAATRKGNVIYFSHPVFTQYHQNAPRWCKLFFLNALGMLLPEPVLRITGPSALLSAVNEQKSENRWVLHLLHYVPERRGQDFDTIEDVVPVFDIGVSIRAEGNIRSITAVPDGEDLRFRRSGERTEFTVPKLLGHRIIELSFA